MTHPMLSRLPLERQREEIERNKSYLEDQLNGPVDSFAYPFGDYSPMTEAIVRESKFMSACTTFRGGVQPGSDPFALPRLQVYDLDGEQFARWLRQAWAEI
jgi:peptidoglycan/xylan/chitin deacetylase (PgdA/CDA1 family)